MRASVEEGAGQSGSAPAALVSLAGYLDGGPIDSLRTPLGLTHSAAVRVVDRLADAGLVRREEAPVKAEWSSGNFGAWLRLTPWPAPLLLLAYNDGYGIRPVKVLLPGQVYAQDVAALIENGRVMGHERRVLVAPLPTAHDFVEVPPLASQPPADAAECQHADRDGGPAPRGAAAS